MRFTDLAAVTGGTLLDTERGEDMFRGVSIDSREIQAGELFIAIRGENQDGHRYIDQALKRGAAGVIIESPRKVSPLKLGQAESHSKNPGEVGGAEGRKILTRNNFTTYDCVITSNLPVLVTKFAHK